MIIILGSTKEGKKRMEQEEWFAGKMPRDHAVMLLSPECMWPFITRRRMPHRSVSLL